MTAYCLIQMLFLVHGETQRYSLGPWTQPEIPIFPSEKYASQIIGYDSDTETIWLIGGFIVESSETMKSVHSFNISSPAFIRHDDLSNALFSGAQTYTQFDDIIYVISDDTVSLRNTISTIALENGAFQFTPNLVINDQNTTFPYYVGVDGTLSYNDGYLLVLGGRNTSSADDIHRKFQMLRLSDGVWIEGPPLPQSRSRFTSQVVNDYLYAIGGFTKIVVRIFVGDLQNINNGHYQWETLNETLSDEYIDDYFMRSVVYDSDIFVVGGYDAPIDVIHTDSSPITISRNISRLISNVRRAGVVVANDRIYVFGGWCGLCSDNTTTPRSLQFAPLQALSATPNPTTAPFDDDTTTVYTVTVTINDFNASNQTMNDIAVLITNSLTPDIGVNTVGTESVLNDTLILTAYIAPNSSLDTEDIEILIIGILDDIYSDFNVAVSDDDDSSFIETTVDPQDEGRDGDLEGNGLNESDSTMALIVIMIGVAVILLIVLCCGSVFVYHQRITRSQSSLQTQMKRVKVDSVDTTTSPPSQSTFDDQDESGIYEFEKRTTEGNDGYDVNAVFLNGSVRQMAIQEVNEEKNRSTAPCYYRNDTNCSEALFGDENNVEERTAGGITPCSNVDNSLEGATCASTPGFV